MARYAQITQNSKFAIFCNIFRKKLVMKLHVDKHESLLQIDAMILMGDGQAFPDFSK